MSEWAELFLVADVDALVAPTEAMRRSIMVQVDYLDPAVDEHEAELVRRPGYEGDPTAWRLEPTAAPSGYEVGRSALQRSPRAGWVRVTATWPVAA